MTIDKHLLLKDFLFLSSDDIILHKFTKSPSDSMSYETVRSAFIFPISGKAKISFGNDHFMTNTSQVIHGCPNKKVTFKVIGDEPFEHINLYYSPPAHLNTQRHYLHSTYEFSVEDPQRLSLLLEKLLALYASSSPKDVLKREVLFHALLSCMFSDPHPNDDQKDLVRHAVHYIESHYYESLTLQALAEKFNKTPEQFSYLFFKYMGIRPIDYLIQLRLKKAFSLLNEGYKVKEAAESVGYQDPYYFSRLFKKHFNFSPSQINK